MSKNKNKKPLKQGFIKNRSNSTPKKVASPTSNNHASPQNNDRGHSSGNSLWLYGHHAVTAALKNPNRKIIRLMVTKRSQDQYQSILSEIHLKHRALNPEIVTIDVFESCLPSDSVHQGIALLTTPLSPFYIEECCKVTAGQKNIVLVLDQVTDPHNVGAMIRSAAAFGVKAIITTDRHAPPESGALAKSASGTLEILPWIRVTNLSRALDQLAEIGYWRIGLDGHASKNINEVDFGNNIALVMGAEGKGLRKGTADHCDALVKLPISRDVESLNVSNAAAVALYVFAS